MNIWNLHQQDYNGLIDQAVREDLGDGDVTSEATIPADQVGTGELVFRQPGILCGIPVVQEVLRRYDGKMRLTAAAQDGGRIGVGESIGRIEGNLRPLLAAERVVLNFLQRLSGIATVTSHYVEAIGGTQAIICDTRKTTPGWRTLEKYAVRCGGGKNHRMGLYDAVLIKDNHLAAMSDGDWIIRLKEALSRLQPRRNRIAFVEVEVDTLSQLEQVLTVDGVGMVLLDNMTCEQLARAVQLRNQLAVNKNLLLEASGGITLETVAAVAATGVDRISVGAITHGAAGVDIGLDIVATG